MKNYITLNMPERTKTNYYSWQISHHSILPGEHACIEVSQICSSDQISSFRSGMLLSSGSWNHEMQCGVAMSAVQWRCSQSRIAITDFS